MARPKRAEGLDYFPLVCSVDTKLKLLEAEFGLNGFSVYVKLLQSAYGDKGYYIRWTRDVALLFSAEVHLGANVVREIVQRATELGLFDAGLLNKYGILTSHGIQKTYFEAVAKRKEVLCEKRYLLVDVPGNAVYADETGVCDGENPTKKSKAKLKNSRERGAAAAAENSPAPLGRYKNVILTDDELKGLRADFGEDRTAEYTERFSLYLRSTGRAFACHEATIRKWLTEDAQPSGNQRSAGAAGYDPAKIQDDPGRLDPSNTKRPT